MIKVEILKGEDGKTMVFFEGSKEEEKDTLDAILEALVGPYPRRGAYVIGSPNPTLKVEVNIGK